MYNPKPTGFGFFGFRFQLPFSSRNTQLFDVRLFAEFLEFQFFSKIQTTRNSTNIHEFLTKKLPQVEKNSAKKYPKFSYFIFSALVEKFGSFTQL